jgi:hypothetical protein
MKTWFFIPAFLLSLVGCSAKQPPAPVAVKPTLQPDQVDVARLQPAQGNLAPGVVVYTKDGFKWGRVIKVDPDHVFPKGERGGVLFSDDDDAKQEPSWWAFKMFDDMRVLKN